MRGRSLIFGAAFALLAIMPASAGYVFFHRPVGDWSVLCWSDLSTKARTCRLSAPRPKLSYSLAPNVIEVREWAPGAFQVIVTVRDRTMEGLPLSLRIDGLGIHETAVRDGMAWWSGEEAARIILEMQRGRKAIYRVQTIPDGMPRDVRISFDIYRGVIRSHGLLEERK